MAIKRAGQPRRKRAGASVRKGRLNARVKTTTLGGPGNVASWGNHVKNRRREVGMDVMNPVAQPRRLRKTIKSR